MVLVSRVFIVSTADIYCSLSKAANYNYSDDGLHYFKILQYS